MWAIWFIVTCVNTLRPRSNGYHFTEDIFKCIFMNGNVWIPIKISLKFVPNGPINNIPALVQIMAWCHEGDKPLSEPMMVSLPMHLCVTRPNELKRKEALSQGYISVLVSNFLWRKTSFHEIKLTGGMIMMNWSVVFLLNGVKMKHVHYYRYRRWWTK